MKTPPNQTAFESAPDTANLTSSSGADATENRALRHVSDLPALDLESTRSIAMETNNTPNQVTATVVTDLAALRLPANYGATLGVKKLLTNVLIGKPKRPQFFRSHMSEEMTFPAMILENKEAREFYLVNPEVAQVISELVRPVMLYAAIDRQNNPFLIPVQLPDEAGNRNPWHESLAQAVEYAKLKWIRIAANMHTGGYDVNEAQGELPEPEWPVYDLDALVKVAFRGKIVGTLDHPVVQSLLGRA